MKKSRSTSKSAFFIARVLIAVALCFGGVALAFLAVNAPVRERLFSEVKSENEHEPDANARTLPVPGDDDDEASNLARLEEFWSDRVTYPTGHFNPAWVRQAAQQHERLSRGVPAGSHAKLFAARAAGQRAGKKGQPEALSTTSWTGLGPSPERMTGCSGCYDYGLTSGRINDIVIDPTTTTNGSIVAYAAGVGGGVWKTTTCCNSTTTWVPTTDDPLIATTPIDTLAIDPHDHNTVYAGTGDLNYGSFSMGSQGILKTTNAGASWTTLAADVFGPDYVQPVGQFPQYDAVGKVRVDPNNSNNVVAGTKKGLFFSYDAGVSWTGPCTTNSFTDQRQDITGLELSNIAGVTRIIAAVGTRGFATPVQYDLGAQGANGIYKAAMPASGCASFTSIASNSNGFVFGAAVAGSPNYTAGANMNAGSGIPYSNATTGNQLSRIDLAVAPSDPNTIYAQAGSIAANSASGCGSTSGCQLGAWVTTNGGTSWTFMTGSAGGSLTACTGAAGGGDYPQNWYDQGLVVDPNNADRLFVNTFDTWLVSRTGTSWYDTTCGYNGTSVANHLVHVDHHAQAFVPGNSDILLIGDDGGIHGTTNASAAVSGTTRPTWFNMDTGFNTVEFYSGDISGNFATADSPIAAGGAQDNGPSSATFPGGPTGPVQWQLGTSGDGFSGLIDPIGTGPTQAQGTITLTTGGSLANETFTIGTQTFTFVTLRSGTGQVTLNSSTTTEGNNIVTAINTDIPTIATAARSGATVVVTAVAPGPQGNSIPFNEAATNFTMNGNGTLGGTTQGGQPGSLRVWEGSNSGTLNRCISNCTAGGAVWSSARGNWTGDQQSFVLPLNLFRGGIPGGDDCQAATPTTGCGHLIAGTTRVYETILGAAPTVPTTSWYITNNPAGAAAGPNLTKGTLGNRSYINQVKYSPKYQSVAIVGTNDGNVQIGFNLGTGVASQANWVDVTGGNTILPNRPILGISLDPTIAAVDVPVGYASVGGFNANTPSTPGHLFQVTCASNCGSFIWLDKTGNLPDIPVDSVISNPNYPKQVFAGTDWGVYFTNDISAASPNWMRFNSGMPHAMVWDFQIDRGATTISAWTRGRGAWVYPLPSADIAAAPTLVSAASRMTHSGAGTFSINLPLSGTTGIEPRSDGSGNYTIVLTFDGPVNAGNASANSGANVSNVTFSGNDMIVSLSNVTGPQVVTVSANGVAGSNTQSISASVKVGILTGDSNQNGVVDSGDVFLVRSQTSQAVGASNFLEDINVNGVIDSGDVFVARAQTGTSLPGSAPVAPERKQAQKE